MLIVRFFWGVGRQRSDINPPLAVSPVVPLSSAILIIHWIGFCPQGLRMKVRLLSVVLWPVWPWPVPSFSSLLSVISQAELLTRPAVHPAVRSGYFPSITSSFLVLLRCS